MISESIPRPIVIGLGEVLWDCFATARRPGGAPANVAFHASQLGLDGIVCSSVGTDKQGTELLRDLKKRGLNVDYIQQDAAHPTGTVTVDARVKSDPRYTIHTDVAWDFVQYNSKVESLVSKASVICYGTLAQRSEATRTTIHRCLNSAKPACLLVYDVNLRQTWYNKSQLNQSLHMAQVVKLNVDEVSVVAGLFNIPAEDLKDFAEAVIQEFGVSLVCITRAENGCVLIAKDQCVEVPGRKVRVVDTVGAGDAFTAALIAARLRHCSLEATANFANEVGSLVASRAGGMPDLKKEFAKLRAKYVGTD